MIDNRKLRLERRDLAPQLRDARGVAGLLGVRQLPFLKREARAGASRARRRAPRVACESRRAARPRAPPLRYFSRRPGRRSSSQHKPPPTPRPPPSHMSRPNRNANGSPDRGGSSGGFRGAPKRRFCGARRMGCGLSMRREMASICATRIAVVLVLQRECTAANTAPIARIDEKFSLWSMGRVDGVPESAVARRR